MKKPREEVPMYGATASVGLSVGTLNERVHKATRAFNLAREGAAMMAEGYVISPELSITGAVKYLSLKAEGPIKVGRKIVDPKHVKNVRVFEDEDAYREAGLLKANATIVLDRLCAPYFNALKFLEFDDFKKVDEELAPFREKAKDLNQAAIDKKSSMRCKIDIYKFPVDTQDRRNAVRLGQLIYSRLKSLREMYEDKRPNAFRITMDNVTNLERVVIGPQRELIELAIAATEEQRWIMIANYGGTHGVVGRLEDCDGKIPAFDYTAIDAAMEVFAPSMKYF